VTPTSPPVLRVQRATFDDVPDVARIHVRSWQSGYRGQIPDSVLDALDIEQRAGVWKKNIAEPGRVLLLAQLDTRTIGFCSLSPSRDAGAAPDTAEVTAMYVDPDHYRSGAGTALMAAACAEARGRGDRLLTLWVIDTNQRGRRFYESCGLRWDGATQEVKRPEYTLHELRYRVDLV